ncbi:helix-turn-helix domain-containing protein [Kineococcus sp. SYSU DK005]|uniref:helix-turn-helix domain-containing protein n=1 Tax=Kineococcus sp. SYSU DK005 TaxID=3383126 RepID=UPI003D7E6D0F
MALERQALLLLAHLRKGEHYAHLAFHFGVGIATAYRYVHQAVAVLGAGQAGAESSGSTAGTGGGSQVHGKLAPVAAPWPSCPVGSVSPVGCVFRWLGVPGSCGAEVEERAGGRSCVLVRAGTRWYVLGRGVCEGPCGARRRGTPRCTPRCSGWRVEPILVKV